MRRYRLATILSGFALILTGATIAGSDTPPQFGDPFPGLSKEQMTAFEEGKVEFSTAEEVDEGLGPVFNEASCATCHSVPTIGGGSASDA